jgi:hypothetical protein
MCLSGVWRGNLVFFIILLRLDYWEERLFAVGFGDKSSLVGRFCFSCFLSKFGVYDGHLMAYLFVLNLLMEFLKNPSVVLCFLVFKLFLLLSFLRPAYSKNKVN